MEGIVLKREREGGREAACCQDQGFVDGVVVVNDKYCSVAGLVEFVSWMLFIPELVLLLLLFHFVALISLSLLVLFLLSSLYCH